MCPVPWHTLWQYWDQDLFFLSWFLSSFCLHASTLHTLTRRLRHQINLNQTLVRVQSPLQFNTILKLKAFSVWKQFSFQNSMETLTKFFHSLNFSFFGLLSFSTAWSFIKAPATCTKLCNCGDFLLKKKNCHRGRQPTHQGSTGPNVWGSCEEHTRRDDWSLGHLEKYNLRNFQFPHEHIQ